MAAAINWEAVARAETHPLRLRIIEYAAAADHEQRFSPIDLAREWPDQQLRLRVRAL